MSNKANIVESGRHQESRNILLSSQEGSFNLGQSSRPKGSSQKKQSRVVFGVPKPGKKQKFINVSTHRVDDRNNKSNTSSDSMKHVNDLMPQASGSRGSENSSKTDAKEKQVAEVKSKVIKSRKPPIPSFKTLTQKDKSKPSKPTSSDAFTSDDLNSSDSRETKGTLTSRAAGKTAAADGKTTKVGVEDKSTSETEPRRSVRRIQPTSRVKQPFVNCVYEVLFIVN